MGELKQGTRVRFTLAGLNLYEQGEDGKLQKTGKHTTEGMVGMWAANLPSADGVEMFAIAVPVPSTEDASVTIYVCPCSADCFEVVE